MRFRRQAGPHKTCTNRVSHLYFVLVSLFVGLLYGLIAGFGFVRPALAAEAWPGGTFTYNGTIYPSSLQGVIVTFNAHPGAPNDYIGKTTDVPVIWRSGSWYNVGGYSVVSYSGNEVLSRNPANYWLSESSTTNNPWFVAWDADGNATVGTGTQYYNGASVTRAWYPQSATRTYQFGGTLAGSDTTWKLTLHQDFIRYVVDNSDFRTRYTLPDPSVPDLDITASGNTTTNTITVSWTGNPDIFIQRRVGTDGWETVQYVPAPSPYTYNVPQSGTYRVLGTQSGYTDFVQGVGTFTVAGISFIDGNVTLSSDFSTLSVYATFNDPQPSRVQVQYRNDNPLGEDYNVWHTDTVMYLTNNGTNWSGSWAWSEAKRYVSIRIVVTAGSDTATFYLGKTEDWQEELPDVSDYIETLVKYVKQFAEGVGDLFLWLPYEIRVILISCIVIMITLGLIGWLKS